MMRRCVVILACVLLTGPVTAQDTLMLSLDESIKTALTQSIQVRQLEQSLINSRMNLQAARAGFRSNSEVVFSSLPNFQRTEQKVPLPTGGFAFQQQDNTTVQGELFINQPIPRFDGTFSLVGSMQRFDQVFSQGDNRVEDISYNPNLTLQYRQPLFTLNQLKTGVRRAELNLERTEQSFSRNQLDIVFNVTTSFFTLFQAQRQVEIEQEQVESSENAYRIGKLKQEAGLLPEVDVLRLEIDLANARNTAAAREADLLDSEDRFKNLIGIRLEQAVRVRTSLEYVPVEVELEDAMRHALESRTELRSDEISVQLSQMDVKQTDAQREIKGELFVRYGLLNRAPEFRDAFSDFNDDRSVIMSLTVPLWDWGRNSSEVQAATANLRQSELTKQDRINTIRQEIRTAVRNLRSTQQRVEITRRSEELAQKNYRITLLRFENGDISSQELALEQNRLTQARTNFLTAIIDFKQTLADLRRKTLWDYETNSPVQVDVPQR